MSNSTKISFELVPDDDGYPPVGVETLNASRLEENKFRLENTPFFVSGVAYGDIVEARQSPSGGYEFVQCLDESGFKSISIILLSEALDRNLMDTLRGCNAVIEYGEFNSIRMVAISVPESFDYSNFRVLLNNFESEGLISYAELAV